MVIYMKIWIIIIILNQLLIFLITWYIKIFIVILLITKMLMIIVNGKINVNYNSKSNGNFDNSGFVNYN